MFHLLVYQLDHLGLRCDGNPSGALFWHTMTYLVAQGDIIFWGIFKKKLHVAMRLMAWTTGRYCISQRCLLLQ